jgi:type I restriction enzyme S subunit
MQTRAYRDSIDLIKVGSSASMQKISQENFGNIPFPSLPIDRQRKIADEVDRAVREFRTAARDIDRAITLAKERRAALITAAVTGQIDVTAKHRPAAEQLEDDIKELS